MTDCFFVWSGGKDSALALHRAQKSGEYSIKYLLTTVNQKFNRITMHGVRVELLEKQAELIGIPLKQVLVPENPDMATYEAKMKEAYLELKAEGLETALFGDIFLEDLRIYRENQLNKIGLKAVFPIWLERSEDLMQEFISLNFKAVLVCVSDAKLGRSFIGREIDKSLLNDLPAEVDPCGENGEYHSFVYAGPIFKKNISIKPGEIIFRDYAASLTDREIINYDSRFWFCDILLADK